MLKLRLLIKIYITFTKLNFNSPQNVYSLKDKYLTIRPNAKIIIDRSFVRLVAVTYIHDKDEVFTKYRPH